MMLKQLHAIKEALENHVDKINMAMSNNQNTAEIDYLKIWVDNEVYHLDMNADFHCELCGCIDNMIKLQVEYEQEHIGKFYFTIDTIKYNAKVTMNDNGRPYMMIAGGEFMYELHMDVDGQTLVGNLQLMEKGITKEIVGSYTFTSRDYLLEDFCEPLADLIWQYFELPISKVPPTIFRTYQLYTQDEGCGPEHEHQVTGIQMHDGSMFIEVDEDLQWYITYDSFLQSFKLYSIDTFYSFGSNLDKIKNHKLLPFQECGMTDEYDDLRTCVSQDLAAFIEATFVK